MIYFDYFFFLTNIAKINCSRKKLIYSSIATVKFIHYQLELIQHTVSNLCVPDTLSILVPIYMFVDCCYCKRASWKIGLESNELPSLNKEFTYLLLTYYTTSTFQCSQFLPHIHFSVYPILTPYPLSSVPNSYPISTVQ